MGNNGKKPKHPGLKDMKVQVKLGQKELEKRVEKMANESKKILSKAKSNIAPLAQDLSLQAHLAKMESKDFVKEESKEIKKTLDKTFRDLKTDVNKLVERFKKDMHKKIDKWNKLSESPKNR